MSINKSSNTEKIIKKFLDNNEIKFIDLFAGIGGFHSAIQTYSKEYKLNSNCVFVSEIDSQAIQTYVANYNVNKNKIINIRDIDDSCSIVPNHDILFGGFPCQTFSNAGNKKGFLDEIRGTLFFEIAKILENKKPKYILLENVKHLTKHDNGKTWKIIYETLQKLGYVLPKNPLILSPEQFGIPQDRKRVFIPGIRKEFTNQKYINLNFEQYFNEILNDKNIDKISNHIRNKFLDKKVDEKYLLKNDINGKKLLKIFDAWDEFIKNILMPVGRTLPVIWLNEITKKYDINKLPKWKQKYLIDMWNLYDNNKKFIDDWMKKHNTDSWKIREKKFEWQAGKENNDIKKTFIQLRQSGIRCKKPTKFPTLVAMVQVPIIFDTQIRQWRYLTPRENAKIQSFPNNFKLFNELSKENKDFYSYKQFGNSINVKVVYHVIKELLNNY